MQIISTLSRVQLTVLPNRIANLSYLGYEIVIILTPGKKVNYFIRLFSSIFDIAHNLYLCNKVLTIEN